MKISKPIIVSHRFETLKMCDKLYFVENGKVLELKNFEELISKYKKISYIFSIYNGSKLIFIRN